MSTLDQIAGKIIKEQELIIGPIAWDEAAKAAGLHIVDRKAGTVTIDGDDLKTIDNLVSQYEHFFGRAAREVCKEAAASLLADLPSADVPPSLR